MDGRAPEERLGDTLLEMGWLLAALLAPLSVNLWAEQPFEPFKAGVARTLAWLLAGAWLADGLIGRRSPWRELEGNPLLWPAVALGGVQAAATAVAADRGLSLWGSYARAQGALTLLSYLLLFLVVSARLRTLAQARRLLTALVMAAVPLAGLGLAQALGWDAVGLISDARSPLYTTLGRSNFTGAYLALLLPLTATLAATAAGRGRRLAGGALLAAELAVIGLTLARGAWLAAAAGLGSLALLWYWPQLSRRRRRVILAAGLAGLIGGLGGTLWLGHEGGSEAARLTIWQATLELVGQRPWLGYGPDALELVFPRVYPPQLVYYQGRGVVVDRAHNLALDWAVTTGLAGVLAWLALWAAAFRTGWRAAQATAEPERRLTLLACLAAVAGNAAGNLVSFDVTATATATWLLLALLPALGGRAAPGPFSPSPQPSPPGEREPPPTPGRGGDWPPETDAARGHTRWLRWLAAGLLLAGVGGAVLQLNVRPLAANVAARTAARRSEAGDWPGAIAALERATHLWPAEPAYHRELSWAYLQQAAGQDPRRWLEQAEAELLAARDLRPGDYGTWAALGELYGLWGNRWEPAQVALAHEAYRQATALAPHQAMLYTAWGMVHLEGNDPAGAAARFGQAVALDATDGYAFTHLGDAELARGHVEAALAAYRQAVHWAPEWVPAHVGLATSAWRLGQRDAAEAAWRQAAQIDPDHPAVQALWEEMNRQP
ncbi:MAG: O-antigen ligase family protein [Anaerolineae bacterium]|nr:O-antigen ligase family protein [Anaerolineae bacterium]